MDLQTANMTYRNLGNSGLRVSSISWGNWADNRDIEKTKESVTFCLQNGVNYFDTSYGYDLAEQSLGQALKELNVKRQSIVVSTRVFRLGDLNENSFLSRKHVMESLKNSLGRLQLKNVDVVYAHRYDAQTPLEEVCRAFNTAVEKELTYYWATSEWSSSQFAEAIKICEKHNLHKPITNFKLTNKNWTQVACGFALNEKVAGNQKRNLSSDLSKIHWLASNTSLNAKLKSIAEKLALNLNQLCVSYGLSHNQLSTYTLSTDKQNFESILKSIFSVASINEEVKKEIQAILDNFSFVDSINWKK